ncbi:uncharacterized protein EKO05_0004613 [Ascochyta rabiei]|uniref:uncharacterized protein n=1 Tax=Didymella rabiei TaxID=5454 RepID=UPI0021F9E0F4|nr:uncharacterized protein EKO05_0004613 [Ascochyta rabiei]UPX14122.1 hypothetical protein EKO05_0004613 [Ascochyta rabiei]
MLQALFSEGLPRGRSQYNTYPVFVPSLAVYLDALIYHSNHYGYSKPGLATIASLQIRNLTRYLYLELPHQQLPLLIELEEYEYMDEYLGRYKRKPFSVYRRASGSDVEAYKWKSRIQPAIPTGVEQRANQENRNVYHGAEVYDSQKLAY